MEPQPLGDTEGTADEGRETGQKRPDVSLPRILHHCTRMEDTISQSLTGSTLRCVSHDGSLRPASAGPCKSVRRDAAHTGAHAQGTGKSHAGHPAESANFRVAPSHKGAKLSAVPPYYNLMQSSLSKSASSPDVSAADLPRQGPLKDDPLQAGSEAQPPRRPTSAVHLSPVPTRSLRELRMQRDIGQGEPGSSGTLKLAASPGVWATGPRGDGAHQAGDITEYTLKGAVVGNGMPGHESGRLDASDHAGSSITVREDEELAAQIRHDGQLTVAGLREAYEDELRCSAQRLVRCEEAAAHNHARQHAMWEQALVTLAAREGRSAQAGGAGREGEDWSMLRAADIRVAGASRHGAQGRDVGRQHALGAAQAHLNAVHEKMDSWHHRLLEVKACVAEEGEARRANADGLNARLLQHYRGLANATSHRLEQLAEQVLQFEREEQHTCARRGASFASGNTPGTLPVTGDMKTARPWQHRLHQVGVQGSVDRELASEIQAVCKGDGADHRAADNGNVGDRGEHAPAEVTQRRMERRRENEREYLHAAYMQAFSQHNLDLKKAYHEIWREHAEVKALEGKLQELELSGAESQEIAASCESQAQHCTTEEEASAAEHRDALAQCDSRFSELRQEVQDANTMIDVWHEKFQAMDAEVSSALADAGPGGRRDARSAEQEEALAQCHSRLRGESREAAAWRHRFESAEHSRSVEVVASRAEEAAGRKAKAAVQRAVMRWVAAVGVPDRYRQRGARVDEAWRRAITAGQLNDLGDFVEHALESAAISDWDLKSNRGKIAWRSANLYHVCSLFVEPLTCSEWCSFVEIVARGPQEPAFFASHWWGTPFRDTVAMLSFHAKRPGASAAATPYWMCTFANNQHDLQGVAAQADLLEIPFARAITGASCRGVVLLMNETSEPFRRAWCVCEAFVGGAVARKPLDIAVVIPDGLQQKGGSAIPRSVALLVDDGGGSTHDEVEAEGAWFPKEVLRGGADVDITEASTSVPEDQQDILRLLASEPGAQRPPLQRQERYDEVNFAVRRMFAPGALFSAATHGNIAEAARLLQAGLVSPDWQDADGMTAAYVAASGNQAGMLEFLVHSGASPHLATRSGVTPACVAAQEDSVAALELLIRSGADPHQADLHGTTPASFAAAGNSVGTLERLLRRRADPSRAASTGETPLTRAADNAAVEAVQLLIDARADVHAAGFQGETAVDCARAARDAARTTEEAARADAIVQALLLAGAAAR